MNIGWIGLGMIGTEMAKRLLAAGHRLTVYPRGAGLAAVEAAGADACADYPALAAGSDLLVLCLFNDQQVRTVLLDHGALAAMRSGSILALHTTGSPVLARELGRSAPAGVDVLDATFSGGPTEIAAGKLTMMVGGAAEPVARALPVFRAYAQQVHHVGPLGHGQIVKLLNNLLFATNLMNAAELLRLAESQGFETSTVARVIQECSGASFAMSRFTQARPLSATLSGVRPYLEKDVRTVAATAADAAMDLAAFARTIAYFGDTHRE